MKLEIELVPKTSHFKNLRSILTTEQWDTLRKDCYKNAKYKCEICGGKGEKHPVECHEIWEYDNKKHKQTLKSLIALFPKCHQVKHIGLAELKGHLEDAIEHLANINNIPISKAYNLREQAFILWEKRNKYKWKLDVDTFLNKLKE